jgi:hypothetical protein
MKDFHQSRERRAELSALAIIVAVLAVGALVKFAAAIALFDWAR